MRIEAIPVAVAREPSAARDLGNAAAAANAAVTSVEARAPLPPPRERSLSISFIENKTIVYRFLDKETGDLVQQVPPEEMLRVMRNIDNLLRTESSRAHALDLRW